ncbi:hypothetical protein ACPA9J_16005 [Pseudomonas aeruginosa]
MITGDSFVLQYATGLDKALRKDGSYMLGFFRHGCVISGSTHVSSMESLETTAKPHTTT